MGNIVLRGRTYFVRYHVPRERQADVGKALRTPSGIKRDITRTLETTLRAEAQRRAPGAPASIRAEVDDKLRVAGLRPLSDWSARWDRRAAVLRAKMRAASDQPYLVEDGPDGTFASRTERADVLDEIADEARELQARKGPEIAANFHAIATGAEISIADARDEWLAWVERGARVKAGTVAGHRAALVLFAAFLAERDGHTTRTRSVGTG